VSGEPPQRVASPGTVADPETKRAAQDYAATLIVPNRIESVRPAAAFLVQTAKALNIDAANAPLFDVAVTEVLTNAVKHGHGGEQRGEIRCELAHSAAELVLRIFDAGPGFALPPPRIPPINPEQLEALRESGYGLPIIQSVFTLVRSLRVNDRFGLELTLRLD
jgi:anti-sigma regulatory factor (Ser/Thr protein kinase)